MIKTIKTYSFLLLLIGNCSQLVTKSKKPFVDKKVQIKEKRKKTALLVVGITTVVILSVLVITKGQKEHNNNNNRNIEDGSKGTKLANKHRSTIIRGNPGGIFDTKKPLEPGKFKFYAEKVVEQLMKQRNEGQLLRISLNEVKPLLKEQLEKNKIDLTMPYEKDGTKHWWLDNIIEHELLNTIPAQSAVILYALLDLHTEIAGKEETKKIINEQRGRHKLTALHKLIYRHTVSQNLNLKAEGGNINCILFINPLLSHGADPDLKADIEVATYRNKKNKKCPIYQKMNAITQASGDWVEKIKNLKFQKDEISTRDLKRKITIEEISKNKWLAYIPPDAVHEDRLLSKRYYKSIMMRYFKSIGDYNKNIKDRIFQIYNDTPND